MIKTLLETDIECVSYFRNAFCGGKYYLLKQKEIIKINNSGSIWILEEYCKIFE